MALFITGIVAIFINIYVRNMDIPRIAAVKGETEGVVADIEYKYGQVICYLKNIEFYGEGTEDLRRIRSSGFLCKRSGCVCTLNFDENIHIGSKIRVYGKISVYDSAVNPGEFDSRRYYLSKGYLFKASSCEVLCSDGKKNAKDYIFTVRQKIGNLLEKSLDTEDAGMMKALIIADKTDLDGEIKELYKDAGASHLLAISGLHITFLATAILYILKKTPMKLNTAYILTMIFLSVYVAIAGVSASSLRALIMFVILCIGKISKKSYDALTAMAAAALITVIVRPLFVLRTGFLMSYLAILGIAVVLPVFTPIGKRLPKTASSAAMSFSVTASTLPAVFNTYYQINILSPFLNILLIPGMTFILGMGFLCIIIEAIKEIPLIYPVTQFIPNVFSYGIHFSFAVYEWLMKAELMIPFSLITTGSRGTERVIVYEAVLILLSVIIEKIKVYFWRKSKLADNWLRRNKIKDRTDLQPDLYSDYSKEKKTIKKKKRLGLIICFSLLVLNILSFFVYKRDDRIEFLYVGQGLCVCVQYKGHVYCYDGGSSDKKQVGKYVIEPYLKYYGIDHVDAWFISHGDSDHISGIKEILNDGSVKVEQVIVSEALYDVFYEKMYKEKANEEYENNMDVSKETDEEGNRSGKTDIIKAGAGDEFKGKGITFTVISPDFGNEKPEDCNENSLTVIMQTEAGNVLFTGDGGEEAEKLVIGYLMSDENMGRSQNDALRNMGKNGIDILQVAHHGSSINTNDQEFLSIIKPKFAVISCGFNNSYGHPHKETLGNLDLVGSRMFRTDQNGCVSILLK